MHALYPKAMKNKALKNVNLKMFENQETNLSKRSMIHVDMHMHKPNFVKGGAKQQRKSNVQKTVQKAVR